MVYDFCVQHQKMLICVSFKRFFLLFMTEHIEFNSFKFN